MDKYVATITKQNKNQSILVTTPTSMDRQSFNTMLNLFRSIDGSKWDSSKKVWIIPEENLKFVTNKLEELQFEVKIRSFKPSVNIYEQDVVATVEAPWNPTIFEIMKSIPNSQWDDENSMWQIPKVEINTLIDILFDNEIEYM